MKKYLLLLLAFALILPSLAFASFDVSLKYGSRGQAVSDLQDFLKDQGDYYGKSDGRFGLATFRAVQQFQELNNLTVDGYFGKASRAAANKILSAILAPSDATELSETGAISAPVITALPIPPATTPLPANPTPPADPVSNPVILPSSPSSGDTPITSNPPKIIMLYTITFPDQSQRSSQTEAQVRAVASNINPQLAWKNACKNNPIAQVITAMVANGYTVAQE